MPACVYILHCSDGTLYTGWTVDLERRLAAHSTGKASRYTRSRLPIRLAASCEMADNSAARREEARVKRLTRTEKLELAKTWSSSGGRSSSDTAGPPISPV